MFFGDDLITLGKKDPLSILWFAGTLKGRSKLSKHQVLKCNLVEYRDLVTRNQKNLQKLRLSGTLLLGLVVIYRRKTDYLISELKSLLSKAKIERTQQEQDTRSIDLPEHQRTKNCDLPTTEELAGVLNECYYLDILYQTDEFTSNLKNLLDQGTGEKFGFVCDFSSSEEQGSPGSLAPSDDDLLKSPDINQISFESNQVHEEIDFGDLASALTTQPPNAGEDGGETQHTLDIDGGGDMFELEENFQVVADQLNEKLISDSAKKAKKRKRKPVKNTLLDTHPTMADSRIRDGLLDTRDIITKRPKIRSVTKSKTITDFMREPSCECEVSKEFLDFYASSCSPPKLKRRKVETDEEGEGPDMFRTPEMERGMDLDGGGDVLSLDEAGEPGPFDFQPQPDENVDVEIPRLTMPVALTVDDFERHLDIDLRNDEEMLELIKRKNIEVSTAKYMRHIKNNLIKSTLEEESLESILKPTDAKIATMGFQRTLYLASNGLIKVRQEEPYGDIMISLDDF